MALSSTEQQATKKPWQKPEVRTQRVEVPTNLMFCSQFCCDLDGEFQCVPNAGVCSGQGGMPGSEC